MFHDRKIDNNKNNIQERALRIAYRDNTSQFKELLQKDNSVSIHQKNIQLLMVENYKRKNRLNLPFMIEIFHYRAVSYYLRSTRNLNQPTTTIYYVTDTVRFMDERAWAYQQKFELLAL